MKRALATPLGRLARLEAFSPLGFVLTATAFAVFHALCELAGLPEHTTFLSGTMAGGQWALTVRLGVVYLLSYFGFVLVTPILLIAAALLALWQRPRQRPKPQPS